VSDQTHPIPTIELLSPEDVARRCGLSRRAIYRAIERGELPAVRLCSRLRVEPEALEAWLSGNRVEVATVAKPSRTASLPPAASDGLRRFLRDEG
jgi:excisionase family DNA binding protein